MADRSCRLLLWLGILAASVLPGGLTLAARQAPSPSPPRATPPSAAVDFAQDIEPILAASCYECHGPKKARGSLRLDRRASVFRGGMSGPAITPGDSEHSVLVRRLLGLDGEDRMPLEEEPLAETQIALIRRWIDQGAVWPESGATQVAEAAPEPPGHWAYAAPRRPDVPAVKADRWPRTPVDRFILARLEAEGLTPSAEASRETLIRRVSLDLVGLPPTPEEVEAFVADSRPDAYERLVDRLLASPHYGERWARPWLDLARYADSHGYEKDRLRTMWKYRDWVIDALNADMPYDQFTVEQIAGDMLPDATDAQRIASGFHRNTLLNQEGGIDVEEARWETLVDRVNTTATVWLGTTLACAQCHNHKYDPFSQRDYYRMLAFFDNVEYSVAGRPGGDHYIQEPQLDLPTPDQEERRKDLQRELDAVRAQLSAPSPELDAAQAQWEREVLATDAHWTVLVPATARATHGTVLTPQADGSVLATGPAPTVETYTVEATSSISGITGVRVEVLPDASLPQGGPGRDYYGNFVLTGFTVETTPAAPGAQRATVRLERAASDDSIGGHDAKELLEKRYDDDKRDLPAGWAVDATRDESRLRRQAVFVPATPIGESGGTALTIALSFRGTAVSQAIGRFRLSVTTHADPLQLVAVRAKTRAILEQAADTRSEEQRQTAMSQYRAQAAALAPQRARAAELEQAIEDLGIVSALVMKERPSHERPSTSMRERGSFLAKGDKVYADTPRILPPMAEDQMPNRLGLARWLVSRDNPLTTRVAVNRAWEQFFGRGLVETSEDFGTQSSPPTHPELLDWLAVEFLERKWSGKALHRLIVTSAAYRQSAAATPTLLERDPSNRLLARGPRFRLDAETLRDVALSASGLLSSKIGGPSVFPPQPEGIWDNPYSDDKWVTSAGEDRYRRGLYTFIRRTSPYPGLMAFDATSREVCTVRRVRTNTPLQALTLLNDEAMFEAARALGARLLRDVSESEPAPGTAEAADARGGSDRPPGAAGESIERARAAWGFRLVTSRHPSDAEIDRILVSYRKQLDIFAADPAAAARVTKLPEGTPQLAVRAAWTLVANALLNLDETVNK